MKEFEGFGNKPTLEEIVAYNVIEEFEALLDKYEIDIPDEDGDERLCRLIGIEYDEIFGKVTEIIEEYKGMIKCEQE